MAQAGLAGSAVVEAGAVILAQAGVAGHLRVGAGAVVGAQAGVHRDVPSGTSVLGTPERPGRRFHKEMAALGHLPDLLNAFAPWRETRSRRRAKPAGTTGRLAGPANADSWGRRLDLRNRSLGGAADGAGRGVAGDRRRWDGSRPCARIRAGVREPWPTRWSAVATRASPRGTAWRR